MTRPQKQSPGHPGRRTCGATEAVTPPSGAADAAVAAGLGPVTLTVTGGTP